MTSPHPHQAKPAVTNLEPDANLKGEYLTRQLAAQVEETASYWATTQQLHREKLALQAELEQVRAELDQARRVRPPKPSRMDEDLIALPAEGAAEDAT